MKRDRYVQLLDWKNHPFRMPLILRGARQVGKSWMVRQFGSEFESFVEINFDSQSSASQLFEGDINIHTLLEKASIYTGTKIIPGKTLLFLDEIQECENALRALRYFKEDCPELHVIAAGSLIDFALEKLGMPVGRVQFMYLYPLSFGEFLSVSGRDDLRTFIRQRLRDKLIHPIINSYLQTYLWMGGMPAVVNAWLTHKDATQCQSLQDRIILAYQQDFYKYARKDQIPHVTKLFQGIPQHLGSKFKYTKIDNESRAAVLKSALNLLTHAGIIYNCYHTSGHALPLGANKNEKHFKTFLFDIGLVQRMLGLDLGHWIVQPLDIKLLGGIAEQFVAQELVAYSNWEKPPELYYWHREARNSNAEVDFLIVVDGKILPLEVKAGRQGGMKSLQQFLQAYPETEYAIKISNGFFNSQPNLIELSLYDLEGWVRNK